MAAGDSDVGICNIGLIAIGEPPIASLTDNRKAAILCRTRYDQIRRETLAAAIWTFARKHARLAETPTPPLFDWTHAYPKPADYIRMIRIPDNHEARWEEVGDQLMSDEGPPLNIEYIYDLSDPTKFSPLFVSTLGHAVGADLAMPLTQNAGLRAQMLAIVEGKIGMARTVSAQSSSPEEWDEDIMLRARR